MQRIAIQIPKMYCTYFLSSISNFKSKAVLTRLQQSAWCLSLGLQAQSCCRQRCQGQDHCPARPRAVPASPAGASLVQSLQQPHKTLVWSKSRSCNFEPMTPHTFQHENIIPLWVQFKRECNTVCALRRWLSCLGELQSTLGVIIVAVILNLSWR